MKTTARFVATSLVIVAAASTTVHAEGRPREIASGPFTITESGSYVVTWDISVLTPPAITVLASDVTIDLNGHSVGTPGFGNGDVILLGDGAQRLQINGGQLVGGSYCIAGSAVGVSLSMDRVTCTGGRRGIELQSASAISITRSELSPARVGVNIGGAFSLRFDGNIVRQALPYPAGIDCGALFVGVTNGTITDNVFDCTAYDGTALGVQATGLVRVERNVLNGFDTHACLSVGGRSVLKDNTIQGCRYALSSTGSDSRIVGNTISSVSALGYGIDVDGLSNTIANNVVSDYLYGMTIHGSGNRVSGNSVFLSGERGVTIAGTENLISGNRIQSGTWDFSKGLVLSIGSSGNVYKNNDLTGTTGAPIEDLGIDNVDAGGNVW